MPTVPTYERQVSPRPILQQSLTTQASPAAFGADVARGIGSVGQGLLDASQAAGHVRTLEDNAAAQDAEVEYSNWLRERTYGDGGFLTLSGAAAVDGQKQFQRDLDTQQLAISSKLAGRPGAQNAFKLATESRKLSILQDAAVHVASERKAWIVNAASARAISFAEDAADAWQNPTKVQESIAAGLKQLDQQAALQGWGADLLKQKAATYRSAVMGSVLLNQAQADPVAAASYLFAHPDELTAQDSMEVWNRISTPLRAAAAQGATITADGSIKFSDAASALLDKMPDAIGRELRDGVAQELVRQRTALAEEAKVERAQHRDAVTLGIVTGKVASEETILRDPMLDDGDKATLIGKFRSEQGATAGARDFLGKLGVGTAPTLNPYDGADQALSEKSYGLLIQSVPAEQQASATAQFVAETGMVPKAVVASVRLGLNSNDKGKVAAALQQSAALADTAPNALAAMDHGKELLDAAATFSELVDGQGKSVEEAATFVVDQRNPAKKAEAQVLKDGWTKAAKSFAVSDVLAAFGDNWLPGGPVAGLNPGQEAALTADYLGAAERAFTGPAHGDANIAKTMALQEMHRAYGISSVSGQPVITKFPPENFYPAIDGSQSYIRDLAMKDARSIVPNATNVMLVATPETAQDVRAGQPPRYNLMYQLPSGVWDMVPSMFAVSGDELRQLSALSAEEHQILFEGHRAHDSAEHGNGLPANSVTAIPLLIWNRILSAPLKGDDVRAAALADVQRRRSQLLGAPAAPYPMSPDLQQRLADYQAKNGFGGAQ
ncbi:MULTISPECIES: hypothetical protein [unclassified Devosia]|uniref:hypothetical protein n=1 Tax=unclassified Devosia TaxID=196773 RepID=UPI001AC5C40A|nr:MULTISPECIES: hypothetical protein [unclassified Devosia]MBN9306837.1 hypothetical protein [Devosia sp.]